MKDLTKFEVAVQVNQDTINSVMNSIVIQIFADDCCIGTMLFGQRDVFLSHYFGRRITSELRDNDYLLCRCDEARPGIDETFWLNIVF
jgi:hypothetical protein